MELWRVSGGRRLSGSVRVQGAKNAVLPLLAASALTGCETELIHCPRLSDVDASLDILRRLGCRAGQEEDVVCVDSRDMTDFAIPPELTRRMRSSVVFLGAILARCGQARLSMPGGCELGARPIDLHLMAMEKLGARVECRNGEILCSAENGLRGAHIDLPLPSVGATENAMLAACGARGRTVITNAALEPEIVELQGFLRLMGADIAGAGGPVVTVEGFHPASRVGWRVMPDRIECATLLCACAAAGGDIELRGADHTQFAPVTDALAAMGCRVRADKYSLRLWRDGRLTGGQTIVTAPYPGFPTDAQPLMMAASLTAAGETVFVENIFENRYRQAEELMRLGADIRRHGRVAVVRGVKSLHGAPVSAHDLRGGAALVTAALAAHGQTVVSDPGYIARGYDGLDGTLRLLGADVTVEHISQKR